MTLAAGFFVIALVGLVALVIFLAWAWFFGPGSPGWHIRRGEDR